MVSEQLDIHKPNKRTSPYVIQCYTKLTQPWNRDLKEELSKLNSEKTIQL